MTHGVCAALHIHTAELAAFTCAWAKVQLQKALLFVKLSGIMMNPNEAGEESYLDILTDIALLPFIPRVDVEFDRVLGNILEDLHQTAENLWLQLTDEAASQQPRVAP